MNELTNFYQQNGVNDILFERDRQDSKWGEQRDNPPLLWLAILGEEVGEANKAVLERDWENFRTELIQVAAVALCAVESIDREHDKKLRIAGIVRGDHDKARSA